MGGSYSWVLFWVCSPKTRVRISYPPLNNQLKVGDKYEKLFKNNRFSLCYAITNM